MTKHTLMRSTFLAMLGAGTLAFTPTAMAGHGDGMAGGIGGGMGGLGAHGGTGGLGTHGGMDGAGGGANGSFGGRSGSNINDQAITNRNGPNADTRAFDRDRAVVREHAKTNEAPVNSKSSQHIGDKANTNGSDASLRLHGRDRANARHNLRNISGDASDKLTPDGGQSAGHISDQGRANGNGPNADEREFGQDRARERSNWHDTSTDDSDRPTRPHGGFQPQ